jgi:hypothetical protein
MTIADVDDPLPLAIGAPIPTMIIEQGYQCGECKLAFMAPKTQPRKKINKHIKDEHSGQDVKSSPCCIQQWFGGDSSYQVSPDPTQE